MTGQQDAAGQDAAGEDAAGEEAAELPCFISAQNEYSVRVRVPVPVRDADTELLRTLECNGRGLLPYFSFASGLFTGTSRGEGGPPHSHIMRQRPHVVENAPWHAIDALFAAPR